MKDNSYSLGIPSVFPSQFQGTALVLRGVDQTPPHIALLHNGLYYSLSVKGIKTNVPYSVFREEVLRLKKPCVLVEIHVPFYIPSPEDTFKQYQPLSGTGEETCLSPIRQWLVNGFDDETSFELELAQFVFDLIETLQLDDRVGNIYLSHGNTETELCLPRYTYEDIINEIARKERTHVNR